MNEYSPVYDDDALTSICDAAHPTLAALADIAHHEGIDGWTCDSTDPSAEAARLHARLDQLATALASSRAALRTVEIRAAIRPLWDGALADAGLTLPDPIDALHDVVADLVRVDAHYHRRALAEDDLPEHAAIAVSGALADALDRYDDDALDAAGARIGAQLAAAVWDTAATRLAAHHARRDTALLATARTATAQPTIDRALRELRVHQAVREAWRDALGEAGLGEATVLPPDTQVRLMDAIVQGLIHAAIAGRSHPADVAAHPALTTAADRLAEEIGGEVWPPVEARDRWGARARMAMLLIAHHAVEE
ncbi:hypothetical protein ACQEU5_25200 [Marinactinospora thermotolerans]|uniref:hypothetical protein n=1 Tax=Marinactinospora thermotolerans TaxID=531310 RepID=UPI003D8BB363